MILNKKMLVILSLFCNCACRNSQYEGDTKIFNKYLNESLTRSIPEDSTNFLVVSIDGCHSCIHKTFSQIAHIQHGICIVSLAAYEKYMPHVDQRVWIDSMNKCDRLKYNNGNIGLIQTSNKKVYNVVGIEPSNIDSIYQSLH